MSKRSKLIEKTAKTAFTQENKDFICRYRLIATRQMTKARIKKELNLSDKKFKEIETKYLELFYGK